MLADREGTVICPFRVPAVLTEDWGIPEEPLRPAQASRRLVLWLHNGLHVLLWKNHMEAYLLDKQWCLQKGKQSRTLDLVFNYTETVRMGVAVEARLRANVRGAFTSALAVYPFDCSQNKCPRFWKFCPFFPVSGVIFFSLPFFDDWTWDLTHARQELNQWATPPAQLCCLQWLIL